MFSVNRTAQTTYYPCEGVIAVGEIKSRLDGDSLEDAFRKVASAKELRRYDVTDLMLYPTTGEPIPLKRNYLSPHRDSVVRLDEGPKQKERAQILARISNLAVVFLPIGSVHHGSDPERGTHEADRH